MKDGLTLTRGQRDVLQRIANGDDLIICDSGRGFLGDGVNVRFVQRPTMEFLFRHGLLRSGYPANDSAYLTDAGKKVL